VDRLISTQEVDPLSKQRLREVGSEGEALQGLLRDTVRALSRLTRLLSVATTLRDVNLTVRNAILSAVGPSQALLVVVLSNGQVENRMIECPPGMTLEDVGRVNQALTESVRDKSLRQIARLKSPAELEFGEKLAANVWAALRSMSRELTRGKIVSEGEEFMFAQPEFQRDAKALTDLLNDIYDSDVLYDTLSTEPDTVTIGREHRHEQMHQLSVVRKAFFVGESEAGIIALVGPTRMPYESGIPLVNFTAGALSESLTRYFG
jgi:heat-inducible transcriptional repressor